MSAPSRFKTVGVWWGQSSNSKTGCVPHCSPDSMQPMVTSRNQVGIFINDVAPDSKQYWTAYPAPQSSYSLLVHPCVRLSSLLQFCQNAFDLQASDSAYQQYAECACVVQVSSECGTRGQLLLWLRRHAVFFASCVLLLAMLCVAVRNCVHVHRAQLRVPGTSDDSYLCFLYATNFLGCSQAANPLSIQLHLSLPAVMKYPANIQVAVHRLVLMQLGTSAAPHQNAI